MRASVLAAALFAACSQAIQITAPVKNEVVDISAGYKVTWTTVSSDQAKANLVLVNMASGHAPFTKDLGEVDLTKGSKTVTLEGVPDDTAYQFNLQSVDPLNTGILAQSQQFEIKEGSKKSSASSSVSATSAKSVSSAAAAVLTSATRAASTSVSASTAGSASPTLTSSNTTAASSVPTGAASVGKSARGSSLFALAIGVVAALA